MFEFLRDRMRDGRTHADVPNVYYPVSEEDVAEAEARMGRAFPPQLRAFFNEIGSGFLKAASNDRSLKEFNYVNRFLTPSEVADLYLGDDEELAPSEGFEEGEIPFFEVGDRLYIVMCPTKEHPDQVCWPFDDPIAPDLVTFVRRLADNPRFYHD